MGSTKIMKVALFAAVALLILVVPNFAATFTCNVYALGMNAGQKTCDAGSRCYQSLLPDSQGGAPLIVSGCDNYQKDGKTAYMCTDFGLSRAQCRRPIRKSTASPIISPPLRRKRAISLRAHQRAPLLKLKQLPKHWQAGSSVSSSSSSCASSAALGVSSSVAAAWARRLPTLPRAQRQFKATCSSPLQTAWQNAA